MPYREGRIVILLGVLFEQSVVILCRISKTLDPYWPQTFFLSPWTLVRSSSIFARGSAAKTGGGGARSVVSRASTKAAAKKVPVMEDLFRDDDEKHKKWSSWASSWLYICV